MIRVLICGDRNWNNPQLVLSKLRAFYNEIALGTGDLNMDPHEVTVIGGLATGADTDGENAAGVLGMPFLGFPAQWKKYGKAAGPIRNQQMLTEGKPDFVLAFHNSIETSRGTKDMVNRARKAGIPVEVITE